MVARTLTDKCPTWQIDFAEVGRRFAQLKLQPADLQKGGRHASFFDERLSYYSGLLSRMSQMAEEAFGPNGLIRKNWMKRQ
ncbi:hypothetical protein KHP60_21980 [Microvirga sp. 3-52]|uniref:hypothetical protein n=1 Tax=Microvirga sp. 3-52 TaxID=2792425 RepID=UPI001BCBB267|nr:hypothetical protein [Microvirga sp. 3-52]MBS7454976.1 hypothetical protein [Microvirga sp. 3-52]